MKRLLLALAAVFAVLTLRAQDDRYEALGAKLEEYFAALAGEPLSVQNAECDYLIESCKDSLVRQFVTLKIYDHYPKSKIMGDEGVAKGGGVEALRADLALRYAAAARERGVKVNVNLDSSGWRDVGTGAAGSVINNVVR